jgi:hypothetical protein
MIGNSKFDFYFIRVCIIGLHYLAPLCTVYTTTMAATYGCQATEHPIWLVVEAAAIAETLFLLMAYLPYRAYLQRDAAHPQAPTAEERKVLFDRCNQNIDDPETYLRMWFLDSPLEEIKRENVQEFLLWAFFNRGGPPGRDEKELEEYIQAMELRFEKKFEPGRGSARCIRLTLDKVDMLHRSLTWYWVCSPPFPCLPQLTSSAFSWWTS